MPFHQSSGGAGPSAISVVPGSMSSYPTDTTPRSGMRWLHARPAQSKDQRSTSPIAPPAIRSCVSLRANASVSVVRCHHRVTNASIHMHVMPGVVKGSPVIVTGATNGGRRSWVASPLVACCSLSGAGRKEGAVTSRRRRSDLCATGRGPRSSGRVRGRRQDVSDLQFPGGRLIAGSLFESNRGSKAPAQRPVRPLRRR
jgi:hypothetical protein